MDESPHLENRKSGSLLSGLLSLIIPARQRGEKTEWTEAELRDWLIARIAKAVDLPAERIDLETPFAEFGLDSRTAVALSSDLERMLGRELPPTLIWDYPTIKDVARFLSSKATHDEAPPRRDS